jgi:hypothetical protein
MNSKGNRVILILVVGLASFTSAMRELNQLRQFGMEANQFIAEWSERLTPAEIPAPVMAKVQTCQSKQSEPSVELPWLDNSVAQEDEIAVKRIKPAKVKKARRIDVDPKQFEVRIFNDQNSEREVPAVFEFQQPLSSSFKFKSRKPGSFRISPRDREILKTLNRSINLRITS